MSTQDRIEINAKVMLGKPVIRGTRITLELILRKLGEGATHQELPEAYPHLNERDLQAAIIYAADALAHEETSEKLTEHFCCVSTGSYTFCCKTFIGF